MADQQKDFKRYEKYFIAGLILLYILSVLINLGQLNLKVEEPRRAIVSMEMLESGNFINPHTLGWNYYNKPPVFNWILAGFMKLTGSDSELVCRMPSLISLLLFGLIHFIFSKRYLGKRLALLSSFFLITCADMYFYWMSNGAEIDVFYGLIIYLQVISIFWFYEKKNYWGLFIWSWVFCAIGFFTKGFTSLIFQFLTLGALCIYARSLKIIFKPQHFVGGIVFLLIVASFLYAYSFSGSPEALMINLLNESLHKSAAGNEFKGKLYKVLIYPEVLFRVLAPWCLLLCFLLKKHRFALMSNPLVKFSFLFIITNIGIYWVTEAQKTRYIIMFIPFVMIIVAYVVGKMEEKYRELNSYLKFAGLIFPVIASGLLVLPFFMNINWGLVILFVVLMVALIIQYFKIRDYRLWLFITGVILTRLIYASFGLPLKRQREFNYREIALVMAAKNNYNEIRFWGRPDTLNLDIVFIDTLYKWKKDPVKVLPYFVTYPIPYYLYRATGTIVKFDTIMRPGQTYVSYRPYLKNIEIEQLGAYYDDLIHDSLILFRSKDPM